MKISKVNEIWNIVPGMTFYILSVFNFKNLKWPKIALQQKVHSCRAILGMFWDVIQALKPQCSNRTYKKMYKYRRRKLGHLFIMHHEAQTSPHYFLPVETNIREKQIQVLGNAGCCESCLGSSCSTCWYSGESPTHSTTWAAKIDNSIQRCNIVCQTRYRVSKKKVWDVWMGPEFKGSHIL